MHNTEFCCANFCHPKGRLLRIFHVFIFPGIHWHATGTTGAPKLVRGKNLPRRWHSVFITRTDEKWRQLPIFCYVVFMWQWFCGRIANRQSIPNLCQPYDRLGSVRALFSTRQPWSWPKQEDNTVHDENLSYLDSVLAWLKRKLFTNSHYHRTPE